MIQSIAETVGIITY